MAKWLVAALLAAVLTPAFASTGKILYHLHSNEKSMYKRTVTNLENLHKGLSAEALDLRLILQGKAIYLLDPSLHSPKLNQRLQRLLDLGVQVEVSSANYQANRQRLSTQPVHQVDNIFKRIIELQNQGYQYITP